MTKGQIDQAVEAINAMRKARLGLLVPGPQFDSHDRVRTEATYESNPSPNAYAEARRTEQITVHGRIIGDLVEFHEPLGSNHCVILSIAYRPCSNASFATRDGALRYMVLLGTHAAPLPEVSRASHYS
jgi:hypothetical protein